MRSARGAGQKRFRPNQTSQAEQSKSSACALKHLAACEQKRPPLRCDRERPIGWRASNGWLRNDALEFARVRAGTRDEFSLSPIGGEGAVHFDCSLNRHKTFHSRRAAF